MSSSKRVMGANLYVKALRETLGLAPAELASVIDAKVRHVVSYERLGKSVPVEYIKAVEKLNDYVDSWISRHRIAQTSKFTLWPDDKSFHLNASEEIQDLFKTAKSYRIAVGRVVSGRPYTVIAANNNAVEVSVIKLC